MTRKAIILKFVVPTVLAIALGTSIGGLYLTDNHLVPTEPAEANQSSTGSRGIAELPNPDRRLSRVHLLLSNMK